MSAEFLRIERIAMRAWPSFETVEYDGWILRFADGHTKRANSVNPHFGSTLPVLQKVEYCENAYTTHGLPTVFRLTVLSEPAGLDGMLAEAGYATRDPTLVLTGRPARSGAMSPHGVRRVEPAEWLAGFDRLKPLDPAGRAAHRRIVTSSEGSLFCALIGNGDDAVACGLGILVDDAVGLFDLQVSEMHRRRGHATSIVGAILAWAEREGARIAYLQVHSLNAAALALYRRFAFRTAYSYWYRIAPFP